MMLNFVLTIVISKFTEPPPQDVQDMVEHIRLPGDKELAGAK
jgi:cation/acetate symporter